MGRKRVVITGLGAVTCLGSSVDQLWDGLINGRSGIRRITQFDPSELPCQIGGEIPDFDPDTYMDRKEGRRLPRSTQISIASAVQAVQDAGLPETMPNPERAGVVSIEKGKTRLIVKPGFTKDISYQEFDQTWKSVIKSL